MFSSKRAQMGVSLSPTIYKYIFWEFEDNWISTAGNWDVWKWETTLSYWYPPVTREMFNILENIMKTDRNLSIFSYLKGPRHLVSLIYRLRVHALKIKYCKDVACTCRDKLSNNHTLFCRIALQAALARALFPFPYPSFCLLFPFHNLRFASLFFS